jgi:general secretion pathway protein A
MPFETSPDPEFIWLSEKHKEALASLKYAIQENKGFLLLTGDIGTGKTTLINCFLNENNTDAIVAAIPDPDLSIPDFFLLLSKEFKLNMEYNTKGKFLIQFENFLLNTYSEQKKALLIIDEAQRLNQQLLEQIRLLSNIEKQYAKLLNIFFVGQNELHELIMEEQNKALRQRIAVHYNIEPLTEPETQDYIIHRLRIAGSEEEIFSPETIYEIFSFSKGYPRLINAICDRALLSGYVSDIKKIDETIIKKCANELIIPGEKGDTHNADQKGLAVKVDEKSIITRYPRADQEGISADVNEQKFLVQKKSKSVLRTITPILPYLIAIGLVLFIWIGLLSISYEYLINIWVIIKDIALNP